MKVIRISKEDFWKDVPSRPGIYFIHSTSKNGNQIPRLLKPDVTGLLYVGHSNNLRERLRMLWRTIQKKYKSDAHPFGKKYKHNFLVKSKFPIFSLTITFEVCGNSKSKESIFIKKYIREYGEVPPFNSSSSNQYPIT
jgi:hypothetical protein